MGICNTIRRIIETAKVNFETRIFNKFLGLLCTQPVPDVCPYQTICSKIHSIGAQLAGYGHKRDKKQRKLCWWNFSLFPLCLLAKSQHFDAVN